jgi:hypothetical protein
MVYVNVLMDIFVIQMALAELVLEVLLQAMMILPASVIVQLLFIYIYLTSV